MARSQWVCDDVMRLILAAMMPANRLAIECSLVTGLRISDVLSLHTDTIRKTQRPYVKDSKTGKTHRIYLPAELRQRLLQLPLLGLARGLGTAALAAPPGAGRHMIT